MPLSDAILTTAATNVGNDISDFFGKYFEPHPSGGGFAIDLSGVEIAERQMIVASDSVVAVPWVFRGTHMQEFLGVQPTGLPVELRGATFVVMPSEKEETWTYSRFIDYLGSLHQLGVTAVSRPAFIPDDFGEVRKYMQSHH